MPRRIYGSGRAIYIHNESALLAVGSKGRWLAFAFWREAPRDNLQDRSLSKVFGASLQKANASRERRRSKNRAELAQSKKCRRRAMPEHERREILTLQLGTAVPSESAPIRPLPPTSLV